VYIDSGSGSMLVSAIVAGAAGAGVVAKMQWRRLTGAVRREKNAADNAAPTTEQQ
jgi:predicted nicotinamide N-methyase